MVVNEIFDSIDGEGLRAGELATFIRLAGCNMRCRYCDTSYALTHRDGVEMTVEDILDKVKKIGNTNITLTGGEPLIHKDVEKLIFLLTFNGFYVNIETNGSVDVSRYLSNNKVLLTVDYKTVSSGENGKMDMSLLNQLRDTDVIKCVMNSEDKEDIRCMLKKLTSHTYIYLSPIFGEIEPSEIVDFMKQLKEEGFDVSKMRIQLQLHKFIWDPSKRGV